MTKTILLKIHDRGPAPLLIGVLDGKVCLCDWVRPDLSRNPFGMRQTVHDRLMRHTGARMEWGTTPVHELIIAQLDLYFNGHDVTFDIPLHICGTTFQHRVWNLLLTLPRGTTATYADIARLIGRPRSVRAVAAAIGANAHSIIIPCHRVIGSGGHLTGYAGTLPVKRALLTLERSH